MPGQLPTSLAIALKADLRDTGHVALGALQLRVADRLAAQALELLEHHLAGLRLLAVLPGQVAEEEAHSRARHISGYYRVREASTSPELGGRWDEWDTVLDEVTAGLEEHGMADHDVGIATEAAGEAASRAGDAPRAVRVLQLARRQWLAAE